MPLGVYRLKGYPGFLCTKPLGAAAPEARNRVDKYGREDMRKIVDVDIEEIKIPPFDKSGLTS